MTSIHYSALNVSPQLSLPPHHPHPSGPPLLTVLLLDLVNQIVTKAQDSNLSRQVQNSERIQIIIKSDESSQLLKEQERTDAEIG